jgi:hypothetical protein
MGVSSDAVLNKQKTVIKCQQYVPLTVSFFVLRLKASFNYNNKGRRNESYCCLSVRSFTCVSLPVFFSEILAKTEGRQFKSLGKKKIQLMGGTCGGGRGT